MDRASRLTPAERTRAVDRVRSLTVGIAIIGSASVVGLGGLAAITYSGHQDATAATGSSAGDSASGATSGTTSGSTSSDSSDTSSGSSSTTQQTAPTIRSGSGAGQVTSGGS